MTNLGHVYILKSKYRDELNNLEKARKMNSTLLVNIFSLFYYWRQIVIFNNIDFFRIYNAASLSAVYYFMYRLMETEQGFY
jgi:hypothetical protein